MLCPMCSRVLYALGVSVSVAVPFAKVAMPILLFLACGLCCLCMCSCFILIHFLVECTRVVAACKLTAVLECCQCLGEVLCGSSCACEKAVPFHYIHLTL